MKYLILIGFMVAFSACGSSENEPDDPNIIVTSNANNANETDNNVETDADVGINTEPDASEPDLVVIPDDPKELRSVRGGPSDWRAGLNCTLFCADEGFECENVEGESIGGGLYSWTNDAGNFTTNKQPEFATCEEEIPEAIDDFGDVHDMQYFYCRCLAPTITRIDAVIEPPTACDDACAAIDQVCEPETPWGLGELHGGSTTYRGTDSSRILVAECATIPAETITRGGRTYDLERHACGCTLP